MPSATVLLCMLAAASGGSDRAQQEIDAQLRQSVQTPEPRLDVEFEGVAASRYALQDASFSLDGAELPVERGGRRVYEGAVQPGAHTLEVKLVYEERKGLGIFTYADSRITVSGSLGVKTAKGLETRLRVKVVADAGADPQHRLKLASELSEEMLAKVDDTVDGLLAPLPRLSAEATPRPASTEQHPAAPEPRSTNPTKSRRVATHRAAAAVTSTATPAPAASAPAAPISSPPPPSEESPEPSSTARLAALVALGTGSLLLVGLLLARRRRG